MQFEKNGRTAQMNFCGTVEMPLLTTPAGRFCYFNRPASAGGNLPTVTEQSFGFTYIGNSYSEPYTSFTETNGTSYNWYLYQASSEFGTYEETARGNVELPGSTTITYFGETLYEYWFHFRVYVTNANGTVSYTTANLQNVAPFFEP
jgi:hypothetical protein